LVDCVEVAGQHRGVEQVLFLLQAAVLEPALGGALAGVQALLDQAATGIPGEGDVFSIGRGEAGQAAARAPGVGEVELLRSR
jgi:hypothetical protein